MHLNHHIQEKFKEKLSEIRNSDLDNIKKSFLEKQ